MKHLICLTALILFGSLAAFADLPRPNPAKTPKENAKKSIEMNMTIRLKDDATEAKLLIPRSAVKQLRAALDDMDNGTDTTAEIPAAGISRTQTIVSGMFLSLAMVFGGMWFVRSGKAATKTGKTLVILAVIAGIGSAATFIYANAGPPPEARSITGKMFSQAMHIYNFGSGTVKLEVKDDQYGAELIVPNPPDKPKAAE